MSRNSLNQTDLSSKPNLESEGIDYKLHPSSANDPKLRVVKTSLLRWVNDTVASKGIVVRDLNEEMTDGHVMGEFLAAITGDRTASANIQNVSSDRNKSRNWDNLGQWISANLKINPILDNPNKKWSFSGIVKKDQSSILLLLLEIAGKTGCPYIFPAEVTMAVTFSEKIDDAVKQKTQLFTLTGTADSQKESKSHMALKIGNPSDPALEKKFLYNKGIGVDNIYNKETSPQIDEGDENVNIPANAPNQQIRKSVLPNLVQSTYVEEDNEVVSQITRRTSQVDLNIGENNSSVDSLLIDDAIDKLSQFPEKMQQVTDLVISFVNKYFEPINLKVTEPNPEKEAQRRALPAADPRSQLPTGALELTEDFHDGIYFLLLLGILGNFFIPLNQFKLEAIAKAGEAIEGTLTLADKLDNARLMVSLMTELNMDVRRIQPSDIIRKDFKSVLRCLYVISNHFSD